MIRPKKPTAEERADALEAIDAQSERESFLFFVEPMDGVVSIDMRMLDRGEAE